MNITVYLGANEGNDPFLKETVRELGAWIGTNGNTLVYGGSKSGLMGELAESVLQAGGKVIGVEPQFFIDAGFVYDEITELITTKDMSERKAKMIELGDVFIAFPGGTGTGRHSGGGRQRLHALRLLRGPRLQTGLCGGSSGSARLQRCPEWRQMRPPHLREQPLPLHPPGQGSQADPAHRPRNRSQ